MKTPDKKPAIRLRPMQTEDFDFFQSLYTDERVMADICDVFTPEQCASSFDYYFSQAYKDSFSRMRLIENEQSEPMGLTQLVFKAKCRYSAEIGIMLHHGFFGQGVGKRAQEMMILDSVQCTKLCCVYARCNASNIAANAIYKSLGFVFNRTCKSQLGDLQLWRLVIGKRFLM